MRSRLRVRPPRPCTSRAKILCVIRRQTSLTAVTAAGKCSGLQQVPKEEHALRRVRINAITNLLNFLSNPNSYTAHAQNELSRLLIIIINYFETHRRNKRETSLRKRFDRITMQRTTDGVSAVRISTVRTICVTKYECSTISAANRS